MNIISLSLWKECAIHLAREQRAGRKGSAIRMIEEVCNQPRSSRVRDSSVHTCTGFKTITSEMG